MGVPNEVTKSEIKTSDRKSISKSKNAKYSMIPASLVWGFAVCNTFILLKKKKDFGIKMENKSLLQ